MRHYRGNGGDGFDIDHDADPDLTPGKRALTDGPGSKQITTPGKRTLAENLKRPKRSKLPKPVVTALYTENGVPISDAEHWSARLGSDVAHARVVTTPAGAAAADALNTRAFTVGNRVFFGSGTDPKADGGAILAHELTHVAQQRGAPEPESYDDLPITPRHDARETAADHHDGTQHAGSELAISKSGDEPVQSYGFLASLDLETELPAMWQRLRVIARGPFGKYLAPQPEFVHHINERLLTSQKADLSQLIAPESLGRLIDRARALDYKQPLPNKPPVKSDVGSSKAHAQTAIVEIGNALIRHYNDSVARMFPRVAALIVSRNPPFVSIAPWIDVREAEVTVSHPMDVIVRGALLSSKFAMKSAGIAALAAHEISPEMGDALAVPTPAEVTFAPEGRLWHWVRAEPADATKEQVAMALFGKPEYAFHLIPMPPLWGFRSRDLRDFTEPMFDRLKAAAEAADKHPDPKMRPTEDIGDFVIALLPPFEREDEVDPVAELVQSKGNRFGMQRAKQRARGANDQTKQLGTKNQTTSGPETDDTANARGDAGERHDEANLLQVENGMLANLDDLAKLLPLLHLKLGPVDAARARFRERADQAATTCMADVESAYAFADTQRGLLKRIALGVGDAASHLAQQGGAVATEDVRAPITDLARAYVDALVAIELPELARPRLAHADDLALNIDIAIQEASLHQRLGELEAERQETKDKSDPLVNPDEHATRLDALAMQLADARLGMRESPVATKAKVRAIKPEVDTLGFEIGLGEKLGRLNSLWHAIDEADDFWEGLADNLHGKLLQNLNRQLYQRFIKEVYTPFKEAKAAGDVEGQRKAQKAYYDILTGPMMKEHAETVRKFLQQVATHKKWTKFVVSLAITFVAFGLGQWEFGAVMMAEGSLFEAAVAGGLVTTATSVVLDKVIFDRNPTAVNVLTSFAFNVGTFFVIGKLALAAKAAGAELAIGEGVKEAETVAGGVSTTSKVGKAAKAVGSYALGFAREAVIAEAMGLGQAQVEKAIEKHELLSAEETEDIFLQSLIGVVGMRVFHATTPPDLFQYKPPEHRLAAELAWLKAEQPQLQARAKEIADAAKSEPRGTPDKAATLELLQRWEKYLERERKARQKLLEYTEKHPKRFKPEDIAKLQAAGTDPALLRQMHTSEALLAVEAEGINRYSCAAGSLDLVIDQHRAAGNEITRVETDPQTGQRTITVKPADGSPTFHITEKVPPKGKRTAAKVSVGIAREFEQWLDLRDLVGGPGQKQLRDLYLRDPEAAINYAQEKYGFQPQSKSDKGLLVKPDAPGTKPNELPREPFVTPGDSQLAVKLGHGAVAIGNGRFMAAPTELADMHARWSKAKEAKPSKVVYDPEANTSHFELEVDGKRVRVEAQLASKVQSFGGMAGVENRVVGGRISNAMGTEILRSMVKGETEMLRATGISGELVKPGDGIEFGLGKLHDGSCVIVLGGPGEVDWSALPGIEPAGHTHPSIKGNDLLPDFQGREAVAIEEVLDPAKQRHLNRHLIFPSPVDFITMAQLAIKGHRVFTSFVVDNGVIRKAAAGEDRPNLEFTIGESKEVGRLPTGERVFEATVEGTAGSETPITNRKVWIVEGSTDSFFEFTEPSGVVRSEPTAAAGRGGKTKAPLSPEMQKLARRHGDDLVHWALATVPEADVSALLAHPRKLIDELKTISAVDARDLLAIIPAAELRKALDSGHVTPAQLAKLRLQLGNDVAKDMISSAVEAANPKSPLERLARIADNVESADARLPGSALGTESLVLDSNARSALEDCQRAQNKKGVALATFGDVDPNYRNAVNAMRRSHGAGPIPESHALPMTLDQLLWPGADLRTAQVAGAEAIHGEAHSGRASATLPRTSGLEPDRGNPDYAAVLHQLAGKNVGGPTGGPDRAIVADTMFAAKARNTVPTLVSVDDKVYVRLAQHFADPPITWPPSPKGHPELPLREKLRLAPESKDGVFTISILGHELNIRYM